MGAEYCFGGLVGGTKLPERRITFGGIAAIDEVCREGELKMLLESAVGGCLDTRQRRRARGKSAFGDWSRDYEESKKLHRDSSTEVSRSSTIIGPPQ
jgi:hypothetical protein